MAEGKSLAEQVAPPRHPAGEVFMAWMPYILLVIIVLVWGYNQTALRSVSKVINWPGLHNAVEIVPPVSKLQVRMRLPIVLTGSRLRAPLA